MTHHLAVREQAIKLRTEQGLTIDQLAKHLGLSRSTVYYWVRDIPIVRTYRATRSNLPRDVGTQAMQAAFRLKREAAYETGREEFSTLDTEPGFRDFVCMYIGEGYKRSRNTVSLGNSDPAVVLLGTRWIRRFARNKVWFRVQHHADQDLVELQAFWSDLLQVRPHEIKLQRKSNSNGLAGRKWRSRHGVLTVGTNDTLFRARLQAWIDLVERSWL